MKKSIMKPSAISGRPRSPTGAPSLRPHWGRLGGGAGGAKTLFRLGSAAILLVGVLSAVPLWGSASGQQLVCTSCHTPNSGSAPQVMVMDPAAPASPTPPSLAYVLGGKTNVIALRVRRTHASHTAAGFWMQVSAGSLSVSEPGISASGTSANHTMRHVMGADTNEASDEVRFELNYTAPNSGTSVTFSGWANAVNQDGNLTSDYPLAIPNQAVPVCYDADGDGYFDPAKSHSSCQRSGWDCDDGLSNDTGADEHPGRAEVCDNEDNDCDGTIDEGCDDDNDDFCDAQMNKDAGVTVSLCNKTLATATQGDDCNDSAASGGNVYWNAPEICDNKDNDCDGTTDEDCDKDGDGYCDSSKSKQAGLTVTVCNKTPANLSKGDDCNDNASGGGTVNPGRPESCNNLDDNCSGTSDEGCDDGNRTAGDGCGPTCQNEPTFELDDDGVPVAQLRCGDGLKTGDEECDDGNTANDDGCSADCTEEEGYTCDELLDLPDSVQMAVTYRDFKTDETSGGHPDFESVDSFDGLPDGHNLPGAPCTLSNQSSCGRLDAQGKPVLRTSHVTVESAQSFASWFRDADASGNVDIERIEDVLELERIGTSSSYIYDSTAHFPLDGRGHGETCANEAVRTENQSCCEAGGACEGRNFHFTTELRYFFQYQGGETLTFRGDDDVWVFINGRLAVDIGGVHCASWGRVVLGDEDSSCSVHDYDGVTPNDTDVACDDAGTLTACDPSAAESADRTDNRFGLTKGGVYEIVLFHAERHTIESNFQLTLAGFLAPRSVCSPVCGDGVIVGGEVCDDGEDNSEEGQDEYGRCNFNCTAIEFCGDGVLASDDEDCDNGSNISTYATASANACAPGCVYPPDCGDGMVQPAYEACDFGTDNNTGGYDGCTAACEWGPYCGDGNVDPGEACDEGANNGGYGKACGFDCQPAPRCGDGIRNGPEECDLGADNADAEREGCGSDCRWNPSCGDRIVQEGEDCDDGLNVGGYGRCQPGCVAGPSCGDGHVDEGHELCDEGANNGNAYGGCASDCQPGPHCGDGTVNGDEACDNGANVDFYQLASHACSPDCTLPPFCGDGVRDPAFEMCDEGADNDGRYGGCTASCELGAYCGDGEVDEDEGEVCDEGFQNGGYGKTCGFDCRPAPRCGDGERNGPEQCDLGDGKNTGEYGGCRPDCTLAPRCGDGQRQADEACDDGENGGKYGFCRADCSGLGDRWPGGGDAHCFWKSRFVRPNQRPTPHR